MPNQYYKKTKSYRFKKRSNYKSMYNIALKVFNRNTETKHRYKETSGSDISSDVPYANYFNDIGQGDEDDERIGNKINMTGLHFDYTLKPQDTSIPVLTRFVMYIDRFNEGGPPFTNIYLIIDPKQYLVILDWLGVIFDKGIRLTKNLSFKKGFWRKFSTVNFSASGSTNYLLNVIRLYVKSDVTDASGDEPTLQGRTLLYYHDA